jgi:PAS domain S-box-containing protein
MDRPEAKITELERELAGLRERDEDLIDFVENASLALHWVGPSGRILWANQAELDLLGYTREEYIGHHIGEFHVDARAIEDILQRLNSRETLREYEARLRRKDGTVRHVLISSSARWNQSEFRHTRCFTRDVTERKRYEQRLFTQFAVGGVLAAATSLEAAAPEVLAVIAGQLDWRAGLLWTRRDDEQVMRCSASWDSISANGDSFGAACRELTFLCSVGLPGRVWNTKAPVWITDLRTDDNFFRAYASPQNVVCTPHSPFPSCSAMRFMA